MKLLYKVITCVFIVLVSGCIHKTTDEDNITDKKSNKVLVDIHTGSGSFKMKGGENNKNKTITINYYKPKNYDENSHVIMVIPGAGRNADDYRNSWIKSSEKYNVLVLSPSYKEKDYDFAAYHLGGVVKDLTFLKAPKQVKYNKRTVFKIADEDISFNPNYNQNSFIFKDFDRIFDTAMAKLGTPQKEYDIFGHSAGGQISHRLAIFAPNSKANRILASNSGSYTVPSFDEKLPFGTQDALLSKNDLKKAFEENLVLFIGEKDNENETGGSLLHSPAVNKQGLHRFSRAQYFYETSEKMASTLDLTFNWQLKIVPNIGHNYRKMGQEAADYLYEKRASIH